MGIAMSSSNDKEIAELEQLEHHVSEVRKEAEFAKKKSAIGQRFRAERKNQKISADKVAELMGTTHQTISNIESGTCRMDMLFRYAYALGLEDVWFNIDKMMPKQEINPNSLVKSRFRIRVSESNFDVPHVITKANRHEASGDITGYNFSTLELSKTYWSRAKREIADAFCAELEAFRKHNLEADADVELVVFKVEEYTP